MAIRIRRREFIVTLGGAAAGWPLAASAQQPAIPVIGFLSSVSPGPFAQNLAAFRQGLKETGLPCLSDIPVLFKSENGKLAFYASKDGKITLTYPGWDERGRRRKPYDAALNALRPQFYGHGVYRPRTGLR